jgi:Family of unknown function (DUF6427)
LAIPKKTAAGRDIIVLSLIKNNNPLTIILLLIFCVAIKSGLLSHVYTPLPVPGHYIYDSLLVNCQSALGKTSYWYPMLVVVNLFLQSLYIVNILSRYRIFPKVTYVPAFVYILLTSLFPVLNSFGETFLLNWVLLVATDSMFGLSQTSQPRKMIFNAGFLLCLAALFQASLLVYFLLLLVAMVMFRSFHPGEWSVAIMGFLTPLYFAISLLFLTDKMHLLTEWWHLGFSFGGGGRSHTAFGIVLGGMALLLLAGVAGIQMNLAMSNIYIRRNWIVVAFYFIISLLVAFMTDAGVGSAWLIALPPMSIIVSQALLLEKNKVFSNFILYFSLILLIFSLVANK